MTDPTENETGADLVKAGQAAAQTADSKQMLEDAKAFDAEVRTKLRESGKLLNLTFAPNESAQSMHTKLMEARALIEQEPETAVEAAAPSSEKVRRQQIRLDNLKLVRIRISCSNPNKAGLPGEILTVHNDVVGTVKKYIPYNEAGEAYHVPFIMFKFLKRKKYMRIIDPPKGSRALPTTKLVPEYSIEVLDPLTDKELRDLAIAQGAAEAADDA